MPVKLLAFFMDDQFHQVQGTGWIMTTLVNLTIQKFDRNSGVAIKHRIVVPVEDSVTKEVAALKLFSIAFFVGQQRQFTLNQNGLRKYPMVALTLDNPVTCLHSIAIVNQPTTTKERMRLDRRFKTIGLYRQDQARPVSSDIVECGLSKNIIDNIASEFQQTMSLELFIDEDEIELTINKSIHCRGQIENGREACSAIQGLETRFAS